MLAWTTSWIDCERSFSYCEALWCQTEHQVCWPNGSVVAQCLSFCLQSWNSRLRIKCEWPRMQICLQNHACRTSWPRPGLNFHSSHVAKIKTVSPARKITFLHSLPWTNLSSSSKGRKHLPLDTGPSPFRFRYLYCELFPFLYFSSLGWCECKCYTHTHPLKNLFSPFIPADITRSAINALSTSSNVLLTVIICPPTFLRFVYALHRIFARKRWRKMRTPGSHLLYCVVKKVA